MEGAVPGRIPMPVAPSPIQAAPARQAIISELVPREHLVSAVGLNSATHSGSRLIGPALGGLAIAAWGVPVCFALNALSFLAVIVALLGLPTRIAPANPNGRSPA